jgi:ketosteroid isomerase-like protein
MIKYRFLLIFCLVFAMSGCAGNKMALTKGKCDINLTNKSIALLSVKISNQYKPKRQLKLLNVVFCPQSEPNCKHDLPSHYESPYKPYKKEKNHFNEYLLSYELKSDTYNIDGLYTIYRIPALISGFGYAKLNLKTEIKPNSISYLGHLDITLREKKSDAEINAGGNVPYIDQSIAGFSSGTFDVVVEDKFDEDMKSFISEYPALKCVNVEKAILPQWIRPEKEGVVAPKVEEPVTPVADAKVKEQATSNEAVTAAAAPVVKTENLAPVDIKQNETKSIPEEAVRNLVTKWLTSWKSGDMKTYRSCYTSDFQSKVMNLDAWVSHKTNVRQKSKNISIRIDNLQISAGANTATAVFTQHYSSAILKYSGKKKLELRKINDEWKIYREIM